MSTMLNTGIYNIMQSNVYQGGQRDETQKLQIVSARMHRTMAFVPVPNRLPLRLRTHQQEIQQMNPEPKRYTLDELKELAARDDCPVYSGSFGCPTCGGLADFFAWLEELDK